MDFAYIEHYITQMPLNVFRKNMGLHNRSLCFSGRTWGNLILLYVFVQVSRVLVVGVLYPALRYFGYGLDWKEATILVWSGLRGAVALSLSLSVKRTSDSSTYISSETGTLFVFFTGGIVFLTLIVNGSTTQFVLQFLKMDRLSAAKKRILDYTKYEMLNRALKAYGDLGEDEELGPVDWPTVKRYIASLHHLEEGDLDPHNASDAETSLDPTSLKDIRIRILNGVQAAYWGMLDEGRITQMTANILMQSVDEAIDLASHESLCDWKGLKGNVHFPNYYHFLQSSNFPRKLVTYITVQRLETACYICAAFLRAHRIARRQLHGFIGDNSIASKVIHESEAEGEEARKFLEDVRISFPQVLHVVKTRQVTYSVLKHLIEYVENLEKVGLLEEKEMLLLHEAVQTDLKRLLRNPPLVKVPKITDFISVHPLFGALPASVHEPLKSSTKEVIKLRGLPLYKEGSKPNGVWLISNGVVKWTSECIRDRHSLHPTFAHGSTLGLYEVLVRKPYMCDMITDSVVLSFLIESDKLLALRSDPVVEDFLWKESAIFLAKLLVPQIFEDMTMQEMRAIVAERSEMKVYLSGENVEIPHHSVGFLLEGFVKAQGLQELVASPAALLPKNTYRSLENREFSGVNGASFSHQRSWYQVETTARVIIFDIAAYEVGNIPQRWSSSLILSADHSFKSEHGGLMSWPENFYQQRHSRQDQEGAARPVNNMSARAVQLNMYGSMVNLQGRAHSFSSSQVKQSNSLSSMRASSFRGHSLLSVRSEGATLTQKNQGTRRLSANMIAPTTAQNKDTSETHRMENSSDESGNEDEVIVRIDSPSRLSFSQAS